MPDCRGCKMPIEFLVNEATGNTIPAQKIRTIYFLGDDGKLHHDEDMNTWKGHTLYVSHFETCPAVDGFKRKR